MEGGRYARLLGEPLRECDGAIADVHTCYACPELCQAEAVQPRVALQMHQRQPLYVAQKLNLLREEGAPAPSQEARLPQVPIDLAAQVVSLVQQLRRMDLYKLPGVAEILDWAAALLALEQQTLTVEVVADTLGALLKHQEDIERLRGQTLAVAVQKAHQQATGRT